MKDIKFINLRIILSHLIWHGFHVNIGVQKLDALVKISTKHL